MKPAWVIVLALMALVLGSFPAAAQPVISAKSGLVSYAEGTVLMGDQPVEPTATSFPDVKENAVLRTEEGRCEVLLTMGVMLRMGEQSSMKMLTTRLIDTRMELLNGSHVVEADEIQKDNNLTIVAKDSTVLINKRGLYRFDVDQNRIKVFDGLATVQKGNQTVLVSAGKMLALDATSTTPEKFDKDNLDALDRWSKRRAELNAMANPSSAKQVHDYGCGGTANFANPVGSVYGNPCYNPCGGWRWNPWYGMITYIPCGGNIYSPYGYRFYSPYNVMRAFYAPPPPSYNRGGYGLGAPSSGGYTGMSQTSGGYSGAMSAPVSAGVSSPSAAASSGTTSSGSAGAASAGHGGGGGGHGR